MSIAKALPSAQSAIRDIGLIEKPDAKLVAQHKEKIADAVCDAYAAKMAELAKRAEGGCDLEPEITFTLSLKDIFRPQCPGRNSDQQLNKLLRSCELVEAFTDLHKRWEADDWDVKDLGASGQHYCFSLTAKQQCGCD